MIRLLFVEDDATLRETLTTGLRRLGWEVIAVDGSDAARQVLSTRHVDVVMSDHRMPKVPGTELLAQVRRDHPDVVRILLTGERDLEVAQDAINRGKVHRLLIKPIFLNDLVRELRYALRETRDESARRHRRRLLELHPRLAAAGDVVEVDPVWAAKVADGLRSTLVSSPSRVSPTRTPRTTPSDG